MGGRSLVLGLALSLVAGVGAPTDASAASAAGAPSPAKGIPDCATGVAVRKLPVYVIGISARGRVCWQTGLNRPKPGSHNSSPLLLGSGMAFADSDSVVYGIELQNGSVRWRWNSKCPEGQFPGGASGGNETIAVGGGRVVATSCASAKGSVRSGDLAGVDQHTGKLRWSDRALAETFHTVPTDDGGISMGGASGAVTEVINDSDGTRRWGQASNPPNPPGLVRVFAAPTAIGHELLESPGGAEVEAIRTKDGHPLWTYPGGVTGYGVDAVDNLALVTPPGLPPGPNGVDTTALDPATGKPLWTFGPSDPGGSKFSDAGGALLHAETGPGGSLVRINPASGKVLWRVKAQVYAIISAGGELIDRECLASQCFDDSPEVLVARNPATGSIRWKTPLASSRGSIYTANLYALTGPSVQTVVDTDIPDGRLTGFDPATGKPSWTMRLPGRVVADGISVAHGGLVLQVSGLSYAVEPP